jgi:uncharacterized protein
MMNCPACGKQMAEQDFGGVRVDVCRDGCKGIWFDWMELKRLDENREGMGDALKEALENPRANDANRPSITCPRCNTKMHTHSYKDSKAVNVDECYACGGFFLDSGELKAIRDTFMTEQQEEQYAQQLLASNPGFQKEEQNLEKEKARGEAMLRMTRLIRPSFYARQITNKRKPR